jgi:hypothetical protein
MWWRPGVRKALSNGRYRIYGSNSGAPRKENGTSNKNSQQKKKIDMAQKAFPVILQKLRWKNVEIWSGTKTI